MQDLKMVNEKRKVKNQSIRVEIKTVNNKVLMWNITRNEQFNLAKNAPLISVTNVYKVQFLNWLKWASGFVEQLGFQAFFHLFSTAHYILKVKLCHYPFPIK